VKCPKCGAVISIEGRSVKVILERGRPLCQDCIKKLKEVK